MTLNINPLATLSAEVGDLLLLNGKKYKLLKKTRTAVALSRYYWFDALFDKTNLKRPEGSNFSRQYRDQYPDILIDTVKEGVNNEILKSLSVLVGQSCYSFPKIEIKGLPSKRQISNVYYLTKVLQD